MKKIFYLLAIFITATIQINAPCRGKVSAGSAHTSARINDGTLWAWGGNFYSQQDDGTNTNPNQFLPYQGCSFYFFSYNQNQQV